MENNHPERSLHKMTTKPKNFAQCYLYGLTNTEGDVVEKSLFEFLMTAQRINVNDQSFKPILVALKSRVNNAIVIRMLQQGNVVLGIAKKEVPASFKVMAAKDPRDGRKEKIFVDVTGLITYQNGFFTCKEIDRLAAYMLGVMTYQIYTKDPNKLIRNGSIQKYSVSAFVKMFGAELDYLRLTGYMNNRNRIQYIAGVYFGYSVMGLDIGSARRTAAAVVAQIGQFNGQEAKNADYYYEEDELANINTFITSLTKTFKLEGLTTDIFVDRWIYLYGKGSHFGVELYPVFLNTVIYAYSGTYMNNMKRIESVLGRDLVDLTNSVLKIGNDMFAVGFRYENAIARDFYSKQTEKEVSKESVYEEIKNKALEKFNEDATTDKMKENLEKMKAMQAKADEANKKAGDALDDINSKFLNHESAEEDLDPQEISKDAIEDEECKDGEVTNLVDELDKDTVLEAKATKDLDPQEISVDSLDDLSNDLEDEDGEIEAFLDELEKDMSLE